MNPLSNESLEIKADSLKSSEFLENNNINNIQLVTSKNIKDILSARSISKKYDAEGREEALDDIKRLRSRKFSLRDEIASLEDNLVKMESEIDSLYGRKSDQEKELRVYLKSFVFKLKSTLGLSDSKRGEFEEGLKKIEELQNKIIYDKFTEEQSLKKLKEDLIELKDPIARLKSYYKNVSKKPLTVDQKKELLTPEFVSKLSTDEYIALWRRLNPYFLSHVTRQGFRDHNAMWAHSGGMKELHGGFEAIVEDGMSLRPPIAVGDGLLSRDKDSVKKYLDDYVLLAGSKSEAKIRLFEKLNITLGAAAKYPDKTAVHLAAELVANDYYGGEKNNEIFFIFPSDVLISQHNFAFNGREKEFRKPQSETKWNDVFVWPRTLDDPAININCGFVFLPADAKVDPETGSQYYSQLELIDGNEQRIMVENKEMKDSFLNWVDSLSIDSGLMKAYKKYQEDLIKDPDIRGYNRQDEYLHNACFDICFQEMKGLGMEDDHASDLAHKIIKLGLEIPHLVVGCEGGMTKEALGFDVIKKAKVFWKYPENTISSKEYWENYFERFPDKKPKHIVYYKGDPSMAVERFRAKHEIGVDDLNRKDAGGLLGFEDNHLYDLANNPSANRGYNELKALSEEIIEEYYND